jgi:hypothetical protein
LKSVFVDSKKIDTTNKLRLWVELVFMLHAQLNGRHRLYINYDNDKIREPSLQQKGKF